MALILNVAGSNTQKGKNPFASNVGKITLNKKSPSQKKRTGSIRLPKELVTLETENFIITQITDEKTKEYLDGTFVLFNYDTKGKIKLPLVEEGKKQYRKNVVNSSVGVIDALTFLNKNVEGDEKVELLFTLEIDTELTKQYNHTIYKIVEKIEKKK